MVKNEMGFIDKIPDDKIRGFAIEQYNKVKGLETKLSEIQSEKRKLEKQLGIQEDGFIDTPSLNIIKFDSDGYPHCSEHGAMNCYKYQIYRCVMCGIAVQLENVKILVAGEE